jgi:non-homologous end joining protein Ku
LPSFLRNKRYILPPQRGGKVVDIMEALKRSMERIPAKKKPATTATAKKKKNAS